nr:hypothetical protein [Brucella anthropi]
MPYVDTNPVLDVFDPTTINPPSLNRSALYEGTSRRFSASGIFYRWLTEQNDDGRIAYSIREIGASEPWLDETLNKIADFRGASDNWDGEGSLAPVELLFPAAEKVAEQFSQLPVSWRPTLNFDPDGQPNFAAYNDDVYLTVTIEGEDKLSWYAVINGHEVYQDDIALTDFNPVIFTRAPEIA